MALLNRRLGFCHLQCNNGRAVFRSIVMDATDSALGDNYISVCIQAVVPFAAFPYSVGFPKGLTGILLVLVYGFMLGSVRRLSKGMLAPLMAHVAADITIFSTLVVIFSKAKRSIYPFEKYLFVCDQTSL